MTQLTKEHLEKALDKHFNKVDHRFEKLVTKQDFERTVQRLATRDDLSKRTEELKAHTQQQIAELARMVTEGFDTVQQQLDVRDEVNQLKLKVARISQAIGLRK